VRQAGRILLVLALAACTVDHPAPVPTSLPPASLPVLAAFGPRHDGIDFRAAVGTPVLAAADGEVRLVGERLRAGRMVVVAHAGELATAYMHLSGIAVRVGQPVRRGEVIGRTGRTGNATTPHLHFAVCRRPGGRCGPIIGAGWNDPAAWWIDGNPCYEPGREYASVPVRLTYPLPCGGSA
jgi:murein DD-endopeptidase MepM/ murein hydrolase activator NlpD